jgi:cellulose synthase/poly-beta-1,6-N-acetylglucosamine synthase-like glycosyltransferase
MTAADVASFVLVRLDWAILLYFLLVNTFQAVLLVSAAVELRRHQRAIWHGGATRLLGSEVAPTISMLAPAYNEEATVVESVRSLITLQYPRLEIVLVNDGSTDGTLDVLVEAFDLVPIHPIFRRRVESAPVRGLYRSRAVTGLVVVDKDNGGKADALNAGLNVATGELVCAMDADTLIEPDALLRIARTFIERDDVVAAGGTIRVANGSQVASGRVIDVRAPRRPLAGIQVVEYLRAFLFGRLGWNRLGGNLIISGAFGLFRREAVLTAGGYEHGTVGEDIELVANLRRRGLREGTAHHVGFVPDPVAWTEAPESLRVLGRQRDRWHRGLADVLRRHRRMVLNPRERSLGMVVSPYFVFVELLGPAVELLGLVGLALGLWLGAVDVPFAILFFLVAYGYGILLSLAALVMESAGYHRYRRTSDRLLLVAWAVLENLGYRQLTVIWRLRGLLKYLRGNTEWGVMARRGFAERA